MPHALIWKVLFGWLLSSLFSSVRSAWVAIFFIVDIDWVSVSCGLSLKTVFGIFDCFLGL